MIIRQRDAIAERLVDRLMMVAGEYDRPDRAAIISRVVWELLVENLPKGRAIWLAAGFLDYSSSVVSGNAK